MAGKPSDEDPNGDRRVTDLRAYRKAREQAKRTPAPKPRRSRDPGEGFLGSNPRAGLIVAILILLLLAIYVLPRILRLAA
jgi:hypothetical protein